MNIIADTNIFLAVVLEEPEKDTIVEQTYEVDVVSPEILPFEAGNALSAMVKRKKLTAAEALSAYKAMSLIPVRLISVDIHQALKLAFDNNIYAYDAYFLQCAKYISCPLLTLDTHMKKIANKLDIQLLE